MAPIGAQSTLETFYAFLNLFLQKLNDSYEDLNRSKIK